MIDPNSMPLDVTSLLVAGLPVVGEADIDGVPDAFLEPLDDGADRPDLIVEAE